MQILSDFLIVSKRSLLLYVEKFIPILQKLLLEYSYIHLTFNIIVCTIMMYDYVYFIIFIFDVYSVKIFVGFVL